MNKLFFSPILFLAAVLLGVFVLWPKIEKVAALNKDVAHLEEVLQGRLKYFNDLSATAKELQAYQTITTAIEQAMPQGLSLAETYNLFQGEITKSGLILETISQNEAGQASASFGQAAVSQDSAALTAKPSNKLLRPAGLREAEFTLSLNGPVEGIEALLKLLEMSSRIVDVKSVNFNPASSIGGMSAEKSSEVTISAAVYYY